MTMKKKASLVYRGNTSLDNVVPIVRDALRQHGYSDVFIKRFEQGTEKESISSEIKDKSARILGTKVFMDETCIGPLYDIGVQWHNNPYYSQLDTIANNAAIDAIKSEIGGVDGSSYKDEKLDSKTTLERTRAIYQHVLSNINRKPTHVYIVHTNLRDHVPFREVQRDIQPSELLKSWFENGLESLCPVTIIGEKIEDYERAGEQLQTSFKKLLDGSWVVYDRHFSEKLFPSNRKGILLLQTPLDNFLQRVFEHRIYDMPKEFESIYRSKVAENTKKAIDIN